MKRLGQDVGMREMVDNRPYDDGCIRRKGGDIVYGE